MSRLFPLLCQLPGLYQFRLQPPTGLISDKNTVTTLVNLVEAYLVRDVVSTPLLAAQSQARWGSRCDIPWVGCTLWAPSLLRCPLPLGCQLLLLLHSVLCGEKGGGI